MLKAAAGILIVGILSAAVLPGDKRSRRTFEIAQSRNAPPELAVMSDNSRNPTTVEIQSLVFFARLTGGNVRDSYSAARQLQARRDMVRLMGRLERRELIPPLVEFLQDAQVRDAAQWGLLLTLRAHSPREGRDEEIDRAVNTLVALPAPPLVLGHLPYSTVEQFKAAEARLVALLDRSDAPRATAARALEALARRNRRLGRLRDESIELLKKGATWNLPVMKRPDDTPIVFESTAALLAAGVMDAEVIEAALGEDSAEIRRLGALALYGGGAPIESAARTGLVRRTLADRSSSVRYEALRAWIRRETVASGCGPIADALSDESLHVVLIAIDALADRCPDGEEHELLTVRLLSELHTPPAGGSSWHRPAHALVAAAKRAPEAASNMMPAFRSHETWQVRMYAARAASVLNDVATLERLAYDSNDNVREAALVPLRRLKGSDSDDAFIAALGRGDYQLVRTAAIGIKDARPGKYILSPLVGALERITAETKDTSRDIRLALIERIRERGTAEQIPLFERLLTDFDPRIAAEASLALRALTDTDKPAAPRLLPRPPPLLPDEAKETLVARVELDTGKFFEIEFAKGEAPLAYSRFARLVRAKYYDGLTFHRVVPNFVVQGGGPGANEYSGDAQFMVDELSALVHARGTVGLSTRGRDTGDAQIFINLADNRTLDFEYTVFGRVAKPGQMDVVDSIREGTTITRIQLLRLTR